MGTWGVKIFDNDIAKDIKSDVKYYLSKGFDNKDATEKLLNEYDGTHNNEEDEYYQPFWLALAITKWEFGRLDESTKNKAIEIIDDEKFLRIWKDGNPSLLEKRIKVLSEAREKLLSTQPEEKRIKKNPENKCPYELNDVIYYKRDNENYVTFIIKDFWSDRGGKYAHCYLLDYHNKTKPTIENIKNCNPIKNVTLLVWSGRLYNKLVKEERFGFLFNLKLNKDTKPDDRFTAGHLKFIETILEKYLGK